jgi:hypothetical protein
MSIEIEFEAKGDQIFIDGEAFDWGLDEDAMEQANRHSGTPEFSRAIHNDIMEHFLSSISEVLGFRPTMRQVNEALDRGFISR